LTADQESRSDQGGGATFREPTVRLDGHRIYVRDYPGEGDPILLMHGLPDSLHLYDRVVPHLTPGRRVVTFDFLGWGASDKPASYRTTARKQLHEVETVIDQLGLEQVMLVVHDASGPPGIDWALAHPDRVAALVLLNTYYQWTPSIRRPGAIALFSTPVVRGVARELVRRSDRFDRWLFYWQVGRFIKDPEVSAEVVPRFYSDFRAERPAFFALNDDLLPTVISRRKMVPRMRAFARPVRIIFGAADPYLNKRVARKFHELFPTSELFLLPGARHYVQLDEPEEIARLILSTPTDSSERPLRGEKP
jgi:pimeloyl-ACP methyl ester carboxylesterase